MAVFTWEPFVAPKVQDNYKVLTSVFENGQKLKRLKHRNPTVWTLSFQVSFEDMQAIRAFFNARKGSFESFDWVDPYSETTKRVRFKEDSLDIESEWMYNGLFDLAFEEVL